MVVSGFGTWPYYYGLIGDSLRVSRPRLILYRSDLIVDESKWKSQEGKPPGPYLARTLAAIASARWPSKKMTSIRSDPSIATRSIMLPKPHVEHIGSAKGRVINECIYLLI
jgi:hypothetical protein